MALSSYPPFRWSLAIGGAALLAGCMSLKVTTDSLTDPDTVPLSASLQGTLAVLPEYDPEAERSDSVFAPMVARALDSLRSSASGAPARVVATETALLDSLYGPASVYPRAGLTPPLLARLRAITDAQHVAFVAVPETTERSIRKRGSFQPGIGPMDPGGMSGGTAVDGVQLAAHGVVWDLTTGAVVWSGSAFADARGGPGRLAPLGDDPRRALLPRLARQLAGEMVEG